MRSYGQPNLVLHNTLIEVRFTESDSESERAKMTPENNSAADYPPRIAFAPLKPKRRCKTDDQTEPYAPVLINARLELRRQRDRITRSGRPNVTWRRVTPPTELSELLPTRSRPPVLAKVIDKIKTRPSRAGHGQGIWALLRCWALAFR